MESRICQLRPVHVAKLRVLAAQYRHIVETDSVYRLDIQNWTLSLDSKPDDGGTSLAKEVEDEYRR